jgi:hypothetical protein
MVARAIVDWGAACLGPLETELMQENSRTYSLHKLSFGVKLSSQAGCVVNAGPHVCLDRPKAVASLV